MTEPLPSAQYVTTETPRPTITRHDFHHICGRFLFRGYLPPNVYLTMRCPKCGGIATFDTRPNGERVALDNEEKLA